MNPKVKQEQYKNFGGINNKISPYQNSPLEFLDIKNFDFQTPGALTQRWGSTQYIGQTFAAPINALYEFSRLSGFSQVMIGHPGGLWAGATTGQSQGISFTSTSATLALSFAVGSYHVGNSGLTLILRSGGGAPLPVYGISSAPFYIPPNSGAFTLTIAPNSIGSGPERMVTFVDHLFMSDAGGFLKYDGVTTTPVGLPPPVPVGDSTVLNNNSQIIGMPIDNIKGMFLYYASYVNNRGFESQIWPIWSFQCSNTLFGPSVIPLVGASVGATMISAAVNIYTPLAYGISAINIYRYFGQTLIQQWSPAYVLEKTWSASGSTVTTVPLGSTAGGGTGILLNQGAVPNLAVNQYDIAGITYYNNTFNASLGTGEFDLRLDVTPAYPKLLSLFGNRLLAGGFSSSPSTLQFSDTGEPEGILAEDSFEVRTNDGDILTAMRLYNSKEYLFKTRSFFALSGDNPQNFVLTDISLEYGCLNDNCVVIFNDLMAFLDQKGLMMYNGANIVCLSDKVQPYFDRMNYSVAINTACAEHDKLRNQIVIGIPVDGSSVNNLTMVYDYLLQAWTTQDGFTPSVFRAIRGRNNTKNLFYGTPSGVVNWFGPSFLSDNGVGFTTYFKTRFLHEESESTTKQFRRLYVNADPGVTFTFPINFYQDYGRSKVYGTTMTLSQFQDRIDFGIPAKSIAFELSCNQAVEPLKVYGFTVESRLQRKT